MTAKTLIALGDNDGAIVFYADGRHELKIPMLSEADDCPDHLVVMVAVWDRLADPLYVSELVCDMERKALEARV